MPTIIRLTLPQVSVSLTSTNKGWEGAMAASRQDAKTIVIRIFCNKYGLTPEYFKEADTLKKWKFEDADIVDLAYQINTDRSHPALVTIDETEECKTIGAVIDLVRMKLNAGKRPRNKREG
jgi:hypothetical protein